MKNRFVAASILIAASVGGIAAFSEDIRLLWKVAACMPFELGIRNYEGKATITTKTPVYEWKKIFEVSEVRGTGNHHCESNCRGEPTRKTYKVEVSLPPNKGENMRELRNPTRRCQEGPCRAWNKIIETKVVDNGRRAVGSFDVWSRPTTWRLSADVYERRVIAEEEDSSQPRSFSASEPLEITARYTASSIILAGEMSNGMVFSFDVTNLEAGQTDHTGIFQLLQPPSNSQNNAMNYTLGINNPNCKG